MSNEIKLNIAASDNGSISRLANDAERLNRNMAAAQRTAANMRPASQTAALQNASDAEGQSSYRNARAGRGTGAEGRDFAKQAQGLGGLVHVYATFAANLFAVSAAFQALSKAADYSNLVKGLDQLGAASGRNLGSMAKHVSDLTDNAISLRDSMEAVAQASSAGMSTTQIDRMALVAKKASQALGRDVADSLSRLSRGITKIEPELLDELGIFVKVDKAAQDYALSIGKTASSLTDYEKRQSFANAALKQAEDKFGKIQLDANPYNKLLASVTNLAYAGGELLNKVLTPIASALSSSPTALGAAMALIAGTLISKAIPALAQWREGLKDAAVQSANTAKKLAELHQEAAISRQNASINAIVGGLKDTQAAAISGIQTALAKALPDTSKLVKKAMVDGFTPDASDIGKYNAAIKRLGKESDSIENVLKSGSLKNDQAATKAAIDQNNALKEKIGNLRLAVSLAQEYRNSADQIKAAEDAHDASSAKAKWWSTEAMRDRIAARAQAKANKYELLSDFSKNAQSMGMLGALEQLDKDIKDKGKEVGKFSGTFIKLQAGILGVIGTVGTFIASLGNLFAYIGIAVGLFQTFDMLFTKNRREQEAYTSALDTSKEAVEGLNRTISLYNDAQYFTTDNIVAYANAIDTVTSSTEGLIKSFRELKESDNWWSSFKNIISDLWNGDDERKLATSLSSTISKALANTPKLAPKLTELLGTSDLSTAGLTKVLDKLANDKNYGKLKELQELLQSVGKEAQNTASRLQAFTNAMDTSHKALQQLTVGLQPSDAWSKFGITQIDSARELVAASGNAVTAVTALYEVVTDLSKLSLLPESSAKQLRDLAEGIKDTNNALKLSTEGIRVYEEEIQKLKDSGKYFAANELDPTGREMVGNQKTSVAEGFEKGLKSFKEQQEKAMKDAAEFQAAGVRISGEMYTAGAEKLSKSLSLALAEGARAISKALTSWVGGVGGTNIDTDLQKQAIAAQLDVIKSQRDLVIATTRLSLIYEQEQLEKKKNDNTASASDKKTAEDTLKDQVLPALEILNNLKDPNRLKEDVDKAGNGAKARLGGLVTSTIGSQAQISKMGAEMQALDHQRNLKNISERFSAAKKLRDLEVDSVNTSIKDIELQQSLSTSYDEQLDSRKKLLQARADELSLESKKAVLEELDAKYTYALANTKDKGIIKNLENQRITDTRAAEKDISNQAKANRSNELQRSSDTLKRVFDDEKSRLSIQHESYDLYAQQNDILQKVGKINSTLLIQEQRKIDLAKNTETYDLLIKEVEEKRKSGLISESTAEKDITRLKQQKGLKEASIELESRYQESLVATEDKLRSIEKNGGSVNDYLNSTYEDFGQKVRELAKNTKSAANTFNSGFINAIDSSIDKFFALLQEGKLTMKDMVSFVRNSLSDVFRDTASQLMKNAWKDALGDIIPKSDQEKATLAYVTASKTLEQAIRENTSAVLGRGVSPSLETGNEASKDFMGPPSKLMQDAGKSNDRASKGFLASVKDMGSAVGDFIDGNATFAQTMERIIGNFGNMLPSFLINLGSTITGALGMLGGGSGGGDGGLLGLVVKGAIGYFTGGWAGAAAGVVSGAAAGSDVGGSGWMPTAQSDPSSAAGYDWTKGNAMLASAKGNVFASSALAAHSNSIVTSPTLFAFAKGGVPGTQVGLMGESGHEAILPLKRDEQGNLGIRGGSGTVQNTFEININVEGGTTESSNSNDSVDNNKKLGQVIKAAIVQELVTQQRPGGLLYAKGAR